VQGPPATGNNTHVEEANLDSGLVSMLQFHRRDLRAYRVQLTGSHNRPRSLVTRRRLGDGWAHTHHGSLPSRFLRFCAHTPSLV
jgi:hypothetical protein